MSDESRLSRVPREGVQPLPFPASNLDDPRPLPAGRLAKVLRYACALHAHELQLGEDYRAREWLRLDARDQALILRWLAWVDENARAGAR